MKSLSFRVLYFLNVKTRLSTTAELSYYLVLLKHVLILLFILPLIYRFIFLTLLIMCATVAIMSSVRTMRCTSTASKMTDGPAASPLGDYTTRKDGETTLSLD